MVIFRRCSIVALVVSFFVTIVLVNIYFVLTFIEESYDPSIKTEAKLTNLQFNRFSNNGERSPLTVKYKGKLENYYIAFGKSQLRATKNAAYKIRKMASLLMPSFQNGTEEYKKILEKVTSDLKQTMNQSLKLWETAQNWVSETQVVPEDAPLLGSVLNTLCSTKIIKADNAKKGTQLKLMLTLEGGQNVLFKPQWYSRNEIISGPVYAGRDRHNGEIAAFHLSLLLNMRRVPLTVGRKINLKREVMPVASPELLKTFSKNGNNICFYGVCLYCEPKSLVCANQDVMEGALIMWLPPRLQFEKHRNPWQRSYKSELVARWEVEENFCDKIKSTKQYDPKFSSLLLDLVDSAIFDFLLDNGDRHHYEVPRNLNSSVFLFDNGKSFGNPYNDHLDILAPLYQCCVIKRRTWQKLKMFTGGSLSSSLEKTLKYSHISPILTKSHLVALDRRLLFVLSAVEICIRENGESKVFF